jgi:esterase/lipase superfamily enzyme
MRRQHDQLEAPMHRGSGDVLTLGHYGRPVLAFPPAGGRAWDFDDNGMISAVNDLLESGRMKIYCVDGRETEDPKTRAAYEAWVVDRVLPFVYADCAGPLEVLTAGCADGAVTAVNLAVRRADLFPVAIAMSGRYDAEVVDALARLGHDHVDWITGRLNVILGVADDADERAVTTYAARLADLGIRHEVDRVPAGTPWGWPAWRHLAATHLPRFC